MKNIRLLCITLISFTSCTTRSEKDLKVERYCRQAGMLLQKHKKEAMAAALLYIDSAITLNPLCDSAYKLRGDANCAFNHTQVIPDYTKAIRLNPKNKEAYHNRAQWEYVEYKNYHDAIADCDSAIRIDSSYSFAYIMRGVVEKDMKDYEHAIRDFNKVIDLDPEEVPSMRSEIEFIQLTIKMEEQKKAQGHTAK